MADTVIGSGSGDGTSTAAADAQGSPPTSDEHGHHGHKHDDDHGHDRDPEPNAEAAAPVLRVCARCRNMRQRQEPQLFSTADLQTPGILKAQVEWEQQRRQRAQQEQQRLSAGIPFDYEPHSFAWCAAYTRIDLVKQASAGDAQALNELMAEAAGTINPVTGEITAIYALCAQKNPEANCEKFEAKEPG